MLTVFLVSIYLEQIILGIQVCSSKGPHPFPRGGYNKKVKINGSIQKFSETVDQFKTNFAEFAQSIQGRRGFNLIRSNEGTLSFPRGDDNEIEKLNH